MKQKFTRVVFALISTALLFSFFINEDIAQIYTENPLVITANAASKKIGLKSTKATVTTGDTYKLQLLDKKGKTISATKVKWSTSNKKVATVSKSGTVTGVKKGSATITATYDGKSYTCKITIKNASLSASKKTIFKGKTYTLTLKDANGKAISYKNIKWSTSKKSVATVSSKGVVKAVKKGSATITATYKGIKYTCKITVAGSGLLKKSITLYEGQITTQAYYTSSGKNITKDAYWGSENHSIAYMYSDGIVRASDPGKTRLYCMYNGEKYYFTVTVKERKLKLSKNSATLKNGETLTLKATTTPSKQKIVWKSSDTNIATVSSKGKVTPLRSGTCEIRASYTYIDETTKYRYDWDVSDTCTVKCVFDGDNYKKPLSGQSNKAIYYQDSSRDPRYKFKLNVTKVIRGAQANAIVYNENQFNDLPTTGYEWCLIYYDISHISNTEGKNTELEIREIINRDMLFSAKGTNLNTEHSAAFSRHLSEKSTYNATLLPGSSKSLVFGALVPSSQKNILLRVPDIDSSTWVKLTPAPINEPNYEENFAALKSYILNNGSDAANGKAKRITRSYTVNGKTCEGFLSYNLADDNIWFSATTNKNTISFTMNDSSSPLKVTTMLYDYYGSDIRGMSTGECTISPYTHTVPSALTFTWTDVWSNPYYADRYDYSAWNRIAGTRGNDTASTLFDVGLAYWDLLLFEETGLSLTDIGFSIYKY